jgi:hypothetical protein
VSLDLSRYIGIAHGIRRLALGNWSQSQSAFSGTYPLFQRAGCLSIDDLAWNDQLKSTHFRRADRQEQCLSDDTRWRAVASQTGCVETHSEPACTYGTPRSFRSEDHRTEDKPGHVHGFRQSILRMRAARVNHQPVCPQVLPRCRALLGPSLMRARFVAVRKSQR